MNDGTAAAADGPSHRVPDRNPIGVPIAVRSDSDRIPAGNFVIDHGPQQRDRFAIVPNDMLRGRLPVPLKALERVLLLHLYSLASGWQLNRKALDNAVMEGRDAVTKALAGLEARGYLLRTKSRRTGGVWTWTWRVTDDPILRPLARPLEDVARARESVASPPEIPGDPPEILRNHPEPHTENQSMAATSGNTTSPQVAPCTENPSTVNQSILEDLTTEDLGEDLGSDLRSAVPAAASPRGDDAAKRAQKSAWMGYQAQMKGKGAEDAEDTDAILEALEATLNDVYYLHYPMIESMVLAGQHPKAVINVALKQHWS